MHCLLFLFSLLTVISFIGYQVWLIEINVNPALHTNCQTLREVVPGVVEETLSKFSFVMFKFCFETTFHFKIQR